jgi:hypothetical protein
VQMVLSQPKQHAPEGPAAKCVRPQLAARQEPPGRHAPGRGPRGYPLRSLPAAGGQGRSGSAPCSAVSADNRLAATAAPTLWDGCPPARRDAGGQSQPSSANGSQGCRKPVSEYPPSVPSGAATGIANNGATDPGCRHQPTDRPALWVSARCAAHPHKGCWTSVGLGGYEIDRYKGERSFRTL